MPGTMWCYQTHLLLLASRISMQDSKYRDQKEHEDKVGAHLHCGEHWGAYICNRWWRILSNDWTLFRTKWIVRHTYEVGYVLHIKVCGTWCRGWRTTVRSKMVRRAILMKNANWIHHVEVDLSSCRDDFWCKQSNFSMVPQLSSLFRACPVPFCAILKCWGCTWCEDPMVNQNTHWWHMGHMGGRLRKLQFTRRLFWKLHLIFILSGFKLWPS